MIRYMLSHPGFLSDVIMLQFLDDVILVLTISPTFLPHCGVDIIALTKHGTSDAHRQC